MEQPDTDVFYAEALEDGVRLLTSTDAVYEARSLEAFSSRVYREDGAWTVAVRFDDTGEDAAYERWKDVAERIEDAYGADLHTDPVPFHETVTDEGEMVAEDGGVTLRYNQSGISFNGDWSLGKVWGTYGAGGATACGAAGLASGQPELAVGGALLGAFGGLVGFFPAEIALSNRLPRFSLVRRYQQKAEEAALETNGRARRFLDPDFLDDVNMKNSIAARMNEEQTLDGKEEYDRLKEADIDEEFERVLDIAFRDFPDWDGVTVSTTTQDYDDAATFIEDVTGTSLSTTERPSIYRDPEALRSVLDRLPPSDTETVIGNAVNTDIPEAVQAVLDEQYADTVEKAGQTNALERPD